MIRSDEMKINETDIALYGGRLLDYKIGGTKITKDTAVSYYAAVPTVLRTNTGQRTLTITIVFSASKSFLGYSANKRQKMELILKNISNFERNLVDSNPVKIEMPDGFLYSCILKTIGDADFYHDMTYEKTYVFDAIMHKPEKSEVFSVSGEDPVTISFYNDGNCSVPCELIIRSLTYITNATVGNISISSLTVNSIITIDGYNKTVTNEVGHNVFGTVDFLEFPIITPGNNEILVSSGSLSITIKYFPTYI